MKSPKIKTLDALVAKLGSTRGLFVYALVLCGIVFAIQLTVSLLINGIGYPLDDSWIHQTYSRSLATGNGWSYGLNPPSAGSTSILWSYLLVPGFWFGDIGPFVWTAGLSLVIFITLIFTSLQLFQKLADPGIVEILVFGLLLALDWHLVWAAGSGMETLLSALGYVVSFFLLIRANLNYFFAGLLIGALVLIRPDGITMIGPLAVIIFWKTHQRQINLGSVLWAICGLLIPMVFLGFHNFSLTGSLLPNTFDAKIAEYSITQSLPFFTRLGRLLSVFITGAGLILVPGFLFVGYSSFRRRNMWALSLFCWFFGFILIYVFRLPVNYQHGRYLIPLIPLFTMIGYKGTLDLIRRSRTRFIFHALILLSSIAFFTLGIKTFVNDVSTINNLMVAPAKWIRDETPQASIIAAHDIGALGYFGNRKIVDLAGLIDPQVIPFIRDEQKLQEYVSIQNADYLLVFSDWYQFSQRLKPKLSFIYGEGEQQRQVDIYQLK